MQCNPTYARPRRFWEYHSIRQVEKILEYFGVASGLLYLLLEIKQHRAMWVVGFATSLVYVFVFFFAKIYADMGLNLYYTGISLYGFRQWSGRKAGTAGRAPSPEIPPEPVPAQPPAADPILYRTLSFPLLAGILSAIAGLFGLLYYGLHTFTDSPIPAGDAFTTSVGIVATWMLAQRILAHWIFWVIVNFVSVYLYYIRELYPTSFLYICYGILAIVGFYTWKKKGIKIK